MYPERLRFVTTSRFPQARVGAMGGVGWRMYLVAGIMVLAVGALVLLGILPSGLAD